MVDEDLADGDLAALLAAARAWAAQDPDPVTRTELDALVAEVEAGDAPARADLAARFAGRLEFGTAGLRGELGAGPMRMNRVLVSQAAAGLAAYLLGREPHPTVVVDLVFVDHGAPSRSPPRCGRAGR